MSPHCVGVHHRLFAIGGSQIARAWALQGAAHYPAVACPAAEDGCAEGSCVLEIDVVVSVSSAWGYVHLTDSAAFVSTQIAEVS